MRPTLLIVDDESRILAALRRSLRREGYRILTADRVEEALALLDSEPVDLVLSDEKMPGMPGHELLQEAARRRPGVARLLITGWSESLPETELRRIGVFAVIAKPWDDTRLKRTLRRALEGPPAAAAPAL